MGQTALWDTHRCSRASRPEKAFLATDLILFPNRVLPFPDTQSEREEREKESAQLVGLNLIREGDCGIGNPNCVEIRRRLRNRGPGAALQSLLLSLLEFNSDDRVEPRARGHMKRSFSGCRTTRLVK